MFLLLLIFVALTQQDNLYSYYFSSDDCSSSSVIRITNMNVDSAQCTSMECTEYNGTYYKTECSDDIDQTLASNMDVGITMYSTENDCENEMSGSRILAVADDECFNSMRVYEHFGYYYINIYDNDDACKNEDDPLSFNEISSWDTEKCVEMDSLPAFFRIIYYDEWVCQNSCYMAGDCTEYNKCDCYDGYSGDYCSDYDGGSSTDLSYLSLLFLSKFASIFAPDDEKCEDPWMVLSNTYLFDNCISASDFAFSKRRNAELRRSLFGLEQDDDDDAEVSGSLFLECDADGNTVMNVYQNDDCSGTPMSQKIPPTDCWDGNGNPYRRDDDDDSSPITFRISSMCKNTYDLSTFAALRMYILGDEKCDDEGLFLTMGYKKDSCIGGSFMGDYGMIAKCSDEKLTITQYSGDTCEGDSMDSITISTECGNMMDLGRRQDDSDDSSTFSGYAKLLNCKMSDVPGVDSGNMIMISWILVALLGLLLL